MDFQTPPPVCEYMVGLLQQRYYENILEPTPGDGRLAAACRKIAYEVHAPKDFFKLDMSSRFDAVVMNPPFTPMEVGYKILFQCMEMADEVVALMPWLTVINSQRRTSKLMHFGLASVTHLPRSVFPGSRVQCCVLHLLRGSTEMKFMIY